MFKFFFFVLCCCVSVLARAGTNSDALKLAQKSLEQAPLHCQQAIQIHKEFKAVAPLFLSDCETIEGAAAKGGVASSERSKWMRRLQGHLNSPTLDKIEDPATLGKHCEAELSPLIQYRFQAQKIIQGIFRTLR